MFDDATAFNADISKWETGQVTNMELSTPTSVSTLFVHWTVSLICFFDLFLIHPLLFVFLHPFLPSTFRAHCLRRFGWWVVFDGADAFNANISKWETGQVTRMEGSTSTSVATLFCSLDGVTDLFF